jgi:hypothetical protein
MMDTCKSCKHWERNGTPIGYSLGLGYCRNIPMFWNATEWDEEGEGRRFIDKYKDHKAFAQDGSDYVAYLLTRQDFGCVSHEPIGLPNPSIEG